MGKGNEQNVVGPSRAKKLARFLRKKFDNFEEVQTGAREDWGQDSIKVIFHRENFSNFLLGDINKILPITFEAWPSLSCDARCPLCTYSINNARAEDDKGPQVTLADTENYIKVINKLAKGGVRSITLTGGGEPLLNPNFSAIINEIDRSGMKWGMFTHGLHLHGKVLQEILETPPKFLRVSLNSSSSKTHDREYRMGESAYEKVLGNIVNFTLSATDLPVSIGVGYAVDPKTSNSDLQNIGKCLRYLRDSSQGRLNYASFRPKVVYYNRDGSPRYSQVRHDEYAMLPTRIKENIFRTLGSVSDSGVRLDIKHHQFQNITDRKVFQGGLGLSWVSQINHLGDGYLLSELNGSPWPDATYGTFSNSSSFDKTWFGDSRLELTENYQSGKLKVPLNLKTAHVDYLLQTIRDSFGVLTMSEVDELWRSSDICDLTPPRNWDFL